MGLELQREIPYEEAVTHWYDTVYLPVVQIIRNQGNLRHFRTAPKPTCIYGSLSTVMNWKSSLAFQCAMNLLLVIWSKHTTLQMPACLPFT